MQDETSHSPTGTKAVRPMTGLSASMRMTARRYLCQVQPRVLGFGCVGPFRVGFGIVGAFLDEGPHDRPGYRAVPPVVVGAAQESLVDGPADELIR
jgi:hypothetical protein